MELVDMKLPKKTKEELKTECCSTVDDQNRWPYGLQLSFEKEQIDKIPSLVNYKIGERVLVQGEAVITSIRMSEQQDGEEKHSIEMQIEKISCEPIVKKSIKDMSPEEYRKARKDKAI